MVTIAYASPATQADPSSTVLTVTFSPDCAMVRCIGSVMRPMLLSTASKAPTSLRRCFSLSSASLMTVFADGRFSRFLSAF